MIHFDLPKQKSSIIKVLGVGGGGSNAVNYMFAQNIEGVDFIICNTDAKALEQSRIPNKIQLGPHLTQGLGAGANPEVGKQATEESLEEIRRILEVNTKMAFITAGMGGGTGTGGAPIISKICRDLGILTVGIVTTPFGFEGPRRLKQAEEGIRQMQPYVDTLLVISNDKLRMQYGNLKMTEAFAKADNVLATAAKCITDIINSRGTIIVDFADVCTVMKNGGVAILGSATADGEDRAQKAIEEALNSPLLNDSNIQGAKWILVNINSGEGEHECTMDEFEVINNYLRTQSGEHSDLIIGTGYDKTLGDKIGITIIATGFEFKDPFNKKASVAAAIKSDPVPEKIVMTLGIVGEEKKMFNQQPLPFVDKDPYAPKLVEERETVPMFASFPEEAETSLPTEIESETPIRFELITEKTEPVQKSEEPKKTQSEPTVSPAPELVMQYVEKEVSVHSVVSAGYLNRPKNIYADLSVVESKHTEEPVSHPVQETSPQQQTIQQPSPLQSVPLSVVPPQQEVKIKPKAEVMPEENFEFQLVVKDEPEQKPEAVMPVPVFDDPIHNEEEDQRRKAQERISKLRNLSFNMNSAETSSEYDNVPAYVRRNMELFGNTLTSVEQFYSKYTVKKDENEETKISSLNTFLDGKKPD
jgi:cell division protein FtsZ